jgi:hypothetical protein
VSARVFLPLTESTKAALRAAILIFIIKYQHGIFAKFCLVSLSLSLRERELSICNSREASRTNVRLTYCIWLQSFCIRHSTSAIRALKKGGVRSTVSLEKRTHPFFIDRMSNVNFVCSFSLLERESSLFTIRREANVERRTNVRFTYCRWLPSFVSDTRHPSTEKRGSSFFERYGQRTPSFFSVRMSETKALKQSTVVGR